MINKVLIKQAVVAMQTSLRQSTSHTKTRGEVSGGGKKPWKQKGTGRARAGSSRSPIWVGGGVAFGPRREKNYTQILPKKMAQKAKSQLWDLLKKEGRVISVGSLKLSEPKTKLAMSLLSELKPKGKTLFVTKDVQPELILATANIPQTDVKPLDQVSILDLTMYQTLLMETDCFNKIYGTSATVKKLPKVIASKARLT